MYKQKYKEGTKIESMLDLIAFLNHNNFVYINKKILHKSWVLNLRLKYLISAIDAGRVFKAKSTQKGDHHAE